MRPRPLDCTRNDGDRASRDIRISFAADHLTIRGGPDKSVHFRIEIPHSMNLVVRGAAGNLTVSGIFGDKDVELNAGNLTYSGWRRRFLSAMPKGRSGGQHFGGRLRVENDGLFRSSRRTIRGPLPTSCGTSRWESDAEIDWRANCFTTGGRQHNAALDVGVLVIA